MHGHSAHRSNITHIDSHRLVSDGVRRMKPANEVRVFGKKVRTKQNGMSFRNVEDCRVVSNSKDDAGILKLCADALDSPPSPRSRRSICGNYLNADAEGLARLDAGVLGERALVTAGDGSGSNAALNTSRTSSTKMNFISLRIVFVDVFQIALVQRRQNHCIDLCAPRRQNLLLDSADGKNFAAQRDLSGHGDLPMHGFAGQQRQHRRCHRDAGGWSVFRNRAFGHVNVDVVSWRRSLR